MQTRKLMRHVLLLVLLSLAPPGLAAAGSFDHSVWDSMLKRYVDDHGKVAYRKLKTESGHSLRVYRDALAAAQLEFLEPKEQLAFWINAYNAMIVAAVLEGYSAEGALSRISLFKRYQQEVAGKARTPDDIEHSIVRPRFQDFRAHFALVCASTSCPKLRREAYVGERLDAQLDDQARSFLNDKSRNRIDPAAAKLELSQIFEWFNADFERVGGLAAALTPYLSPEQTALLQKIKPIFLSYDWSLNAQTDQRP